LPNEKEWKLFATCGNVKRKYPWGDKWPPKAGNFANKEMFVDEWRLGKYKDDFSVTCAVEKSGKNEWGIFGVSGNVWEWTMEKLGGKYAVFGGAWDSCNPKLMQVDLNEKNFTDPQREYDNIGFRIILVPPEK